MFSPKKKQNDHRYLKLVSLYDIAINLQMSFKSFHCAPVCCKLAILHHGILNYLLMDCSFHLCSHKMENNFFCSLIEAAAVMVLLTSSYASLQSYKLGIINAVLNLIALNLLCVLSSISDFVSNFNG